MERKFYFALLRFRGSTLLHSHTLPLQFLLDTADIDLRGRDIVLDRHRRCDARALPRDGAAHHVADGGV